MAQFMKVAGKMTKRIKKVKCLTKQPVIFIMGIMLTVSVTAKVECTISSSRRSMMVNGRMTKDRVRVI